MQNRAAGWGWTKLAGGGKSANYAIAHQRTWFVCCCSDRLRKKVDALQDREALTDAELQGRDAPMYLCSSVMKD